MFVADTRRREVVLPRVTACREAAVDAAAIWAATCRVRGLELPAAAAWAGPRTAGRVVRTAAGVSCADPELCSPSSWRRFWAAGVHCNWPSAPLAIKPLPPSLTSAAPPASSAPAACAMTPLSDVAKLPTGKWRREAYSWKRLPYTLVLALVGTTAVGGGLCMAGSTLACASCSSTGTTALRRRSGSMIEVGLCMAPLKSCGASKADPTPAEGCSPYPTPAEERCWPAPLSVPCRAGRAEAARWAARCLTRAALASSAAMCCACDHAAIRARSAAASC